MDPDHLTCPLLVVTYDLQVRFLSCQLLCSYLLLQGS